MPNSSSIIECVPNVSEGKDGRIIKRLQDAIASVKGVSLLHTDASPGANRTVFTFSGHPAAVVDAAFKLYETALELISMEHQSGAHPRIGVVDVCPLVPLKDITLEQTAEYADKLARRVGGLGVPVYFYEANARQPHRQSLPQIRKGQYENLPEKLKQPLWKPDAGPQEWNKQVARSGATVIGARNILIAYNITLSGGPSDLAPRIAAKIRQSSNEEGGNHALPHVRSIGWYMDEYKQHQVSCNLLNYHTTGLYATFTRVRELAENEGATVLGAEVIGCLPLKALASAGEDFYRAQLQPWTLPDKVLAFKAIHEMNLELHKPFNLHERTLEYAIPELNKNLVLIPSDAEVVLQLAENPVPVGFNLSLSAAIMSAYRIITAANLAARKASPAPIWHEFALLSEQAENVLFSLQDHIKPLLEGGERTEEGMPLLANHAEAILKDCISLQQIGLNVIKFGEPMAAIEAFSAVHRLKGLVEEVPYRVWFEPTGANPAGYKSPRRRFQAQINRSLELQQMGRRALESRFAGKS